MSSRILLSTSCNYLLALAAGIFNPVYGSVARASRYWLPVSRLRLYGPTHAIRHHWGSPTLASSASVRGSP
jgi:hypothetical protein